MTAPTGDATDPLRRVLTDVGDFSHGLLPAVALRRYQLPIARAVADSIEHGRGLQFAAVFSRQSGKDEMLAQLCAYLLARYQRAGGSVIIGLPAITTQGNIAVERLADRLANRLTRGAQRQAMTVRLGRAFVRYVSTSAQANSRGQTASKLLVANEAQDIDCETWDSRFAPMGAAFNVTTLFMGTTWSSSGLLARQLRALTEQERADGIQRVYRVPWRDVAAELPAYGLYVQNQMDLLGEQHPFIKTEYELIELGDAGALFPTERRTLMRGNYPAIERPESGDIYAFTIDVAGEEEDNIEGDVIRQANPRKDSTILSVWRVLAGERKEQNVYELVCRYRWTGTKHTDLHKRIQALGRAWDVRHLIIDATGVGTGISSFLAESFGERMVTPFVFSSASKSRLGWDLIGAIDGGRVTAHAGEDELARLFWKQVEACTYAVLPGPGRLMRWSVPDPIVHDDALMSAALVVQLDLADLRPRRAQGRLAA